MEYENVVRGRYSARHYRGEVLDLKTVRELIDEASWAPSGGNLQPWRILILQPAQVRLFLERFESDALELVFPAAKLAAVESARRMCQIPDSLRLHQELERGLPAHQMWSAPPSHLVVVYSESEGVGDTLRMVRLWGSLLWFRLGNKRTLRAKLRYAWLTLVTFRAFWASSRQVRWVSISGFVHTLVLSAFNRGIASCIHASFNNLRSPVKRYLGLSRNHEIVAIVSLGYAAEPCDSTRLRWTPETRVLA